MTKAYKGAHYDGLDGKDGNNEAGKARLLFLVCFNLNFVNKNYLIMGKVFLRKYDNILQPQADMIGLFDRHLFLQN